MYKRQLVGFLDWDLHPPRLNRFDPHPRIPFLARGAPVRATRAGSLDQRQNGFGRDPHLIGVELLGQKAGPMVLNELQPVSYTHLDVYKRQHANRRKSTVHRPTDAGQDAG